jgi:hypothetical protein
MSEIVIAGDCIRKPLIQLVLDKTIEGCIIWTATKLNSGETPFVEGEPEPLYAAPGVKFFANPNPEYDDRMTFSVFRQIGANPLYVRHVMEVGRFELDMVSFELITECDQEVKVLYDYLMGGDDGFSSPVDTVQPFDREFLDGLTC